MSFPRHVKIVEVSPRDGLQYEAATLTTEEKLMLIQKLESCGFSAIEVTSFVSPKWVPQMADHTELVEKLNPKPHVAYPVLVPNLQGFEEALAAGAKEVAVFTAASEAFTQKNINCSIEESLKRFQPIFEKAQAHDIRVRGYISCVLGCPYEDTPAPESVRRLAHRLWDMGCYEISLGDTIGTGTPLKAKALVETVCEAVPIHAIAAHFHNTYGQAIANLFAVLSLGVSVIDSSIAGLGGCPYARGASGNVPTEDVLYLLKGLGIEAGVDFEKVIETTVWVREKLGKKDSTRVANACSL